MTLGPLPGINDLVVNHNKQILPHESEAVVAISLGPLRLIPKDRKGRYHQERVFQRNFGLL